MQTFTFFWTFGLAVSSQVCAGLLRKDFTETPAWQLNLYPGQMMGAQSLNVSFSTRGCVRDARKTTSLSQPVLPANRYVRLEPCYTRPPLF